MCKRTAAMTNAEQLKALVKSHIERDEQQFFAVAMQVAAHEANVGHGKLAEELRDMIDLAKARRASSGKQMGKRLPRTHSRGDLANLLTASHPKNRLVDMALDADASEQLHRIMEEHRLHAYIREHGLSPRRKLLLVGPPGTGKTMTASALAGELGIPLFSVRLDALIAKFMGETAANLRQVFDAIRDVRGVYFFDEFDAIGSQRGLANDVGEIRREIRRGLNSFLQMIENDQSNSLIVAAANHAEILDAALFRRFDDVIEYRLPTTPQAARLIQSRLGKFIPDAFPLEAIMSKAEGLSYAEIKHAVDEAIKEAVIHDKGHINADALAHALDARRKFSFRMNNGKETPNHAGFASR